MMFDLSTMSSEDLRELLKDTQTEYQKREAAMWDAVIRAVKDYTRACGPITLTTGHGEFSAGFIGEDDDFSTPGTICMKM